MTSRPAAAGRIAAAVAIAATATLFGTGVSAVAAVTPHASYSDCPSGSVCFYTGRNGTGSMCQWSNADNDWTAAPVICSWAKTTNVASVYNNGTSRSFTGVVYFTQTNYVSRIGCTRQGVQGNLAGNYQLRSHEWTTGSCG